MEEKVLFEGKFSKSNALSITFVIIGIVLIIFDLILVGGDINFIIEDAFQYGYFEMWVIIFAFLFFIAAIIVYLMMRNCKFVITDKRIYGRSTFGKQISLPLDKVSMASSTYLNCLVVSTSSGKIAFWLITNGDEAWQIINNLIVARQK